MSEPTELVVDAKPAPGDSADSTGTAVAPVALPVLTAGLLAKFISPAAGLLALGAGAALFVLRWKPNRGRFVLRVVDGAVDVARERGNEPALRIPLVELVDVTLERKATQASGRPTERVRIALERSAPAAPVVLPDSPITPIEAQEWVGKIRVFLRKHDWLPRDER